MVHVRGKIPLKPKGLENFLENPENWMGLFPLRTAVLPTPELAKGGVDPGCDMDKVKVLSPTSMERRWGGKRWTMLEQGDENPFGDTMAGGGVARQSLPRAA